MKWAAYNLLFAVVYPFFLPGFLLRMLRRGGYAKRFGDRFALYPTGLFTPTAEQLRDHDASVRGGTSAPVWIHAVSVGEVQVAGQLMREWRTAEPGVRFCFSTTSSTGWKTAEREVGPDDTLIYNPLDFPNFVKSALKTVRPRAVVLTESEIWPNFIRQAKKYGIPLFLVNARVSDRSAPRYRLAKCFFGDVFRCFTRIFAQSDLDRARLVAAGAPEATVEVTGSFKFDVARRNPPKEAELRDWLAANGAPAGARIILGGSTWPGEDEVLLGIYKRLLKREGGREGQERRQGREAEKGARGPLILVIAPRHFEKADAVEANVRKAGFACVRRSRQTTGLCDGRDALRRVRGGIGDAALPLCDGDGVFSRISGSPHNGRGASPMRPQGASRPPVFLADTTGELMGLYGIADVVFVGKSLCAHGSQNMIEPCLCGKPTLVGPYTENFRPVMSDLLAADAIVQVRDAAELEEKMGEIIELSNNRIIESGNGERGMGNGEWGMGDGLAGLGVRAQAAVARRRGVVAKCVTEIREAVG